MSEQNKNPMTFAGLQAFARRVAKDLEDNQVPTQTSPGGVTGWLVLDCEKVAEYGIMESYRLTHDWLIFDEVWLRSSDGILTRVEYHHTVTSTASDGSSATVVRYSLTELSEAEARERDGQSRWSPDIEWRGPADYREDSERYFTRPSPDRPPFLTLSAALARLRQGNGPIWNPTPQPTPETIVQLPETVEQQTSPPSPTHVTDAPITESEAQPPRSNWFRWLFGW